MDIFKLEIMKKIIIKDDEHNIDVRVKLDSDDNLEGVFEAFRGMLAACGYSVANIDEYLK